VAIEKESHGGRFLFGFEEALGYSIGPVVRDKDGISVALVLCDLVSELKSSQQNLLDRLLEIYRVHGVHASAQHSIKLPGASGRAEIADMMTSLRGNPPEFVGSYAVVKRIDYQEKKVWVSGHLSGLEDSMPASNVLAFYLDDGTRILARPSGTEPKIKFYVESVVSIASDASLEAGESQAQTHLETIMAAFLGLVTPS
jgi:phosphomannomutase